MMYFQAPMTHSRLSGVSDRLPEQHSNLLAAAEYNAGVFG